MGRHFVLLAALFLVSFLLVGCTSPGQAPQPTAIEFDEPVADNWYPSGAPTAPVEVASAAPIASATATPKPTRASTSTPAPAPSAVVAAVLPAPQSSQDFTVGFKGFERRQNCTLDQLGKRGQCLYFKLYLRRDATGIKTYHYAYMVYVYDSTGKRWPLVYPSGITFVDVLDQSDVRDFPPIYVEYNETAPLGPATFSIDIMASKEVVLNYSIVVP